MYSFKTVKEAADYLKKKTIGAQCRLTGGGAVTKNVSNKFYRFGIRVKITGSLGDRLVELKMEYSDALRLQYAKPQRTYLAVKLAGDTSAYPEGLAVGQSATVQGVNGRSLRQWVVSNYQPWTCEIRKNGADGDWIVTRLAAVPSPQLFQKAPKKK